MPLDAMRLENKICIGGITTPPERGATKREEVAVSQPVSRFFHPFDVVHHPQLEPEVKRAILASWASDRVAVANQPALRQPPELERPVPVDDVLAALRSLDGRPQARSVF
jgi:hypothetical protein